MRPPLTADLWRAIIAMAIALAAATAAIAQTTTPGWRSGTPLPLPLTGHAIALLPDGRVLVTGGLGADGAATRSSYLFDPLTGAWTPTLNQLGSARAYHALVVVSTLWGPRAFAIGGATGGSGAYRGEASVEALERDDASGNWRWRPIGALGAARYELRAVDDGAGRIVVSGGYESPGGGLRSGTRSGAADEIDVNALSVRPLGSMAVPRAEHATARFVGETGAWSVLVAGGEADAASTSTQILAGTTWDPIANRPVAYRRAGTAVGDPAGIARVFGGLDDAGQALAACEWYDVKRGWRGAPRMLTPRARFDAPLVAGLTDTVRAYLAVAGLGSGAPVSATEIFRLPSSPTPGGAWEEFAPLRVAASERRAAIDGANLPLAVGGRDGADAPIAGVEIYQPLSANDLDFGSGEIGQLSDTGVVVIENTWLLPVRVRGLRVDGSAEFLLRGDTAAFVLEPGERRSVRLWFLPSAAGERTGRLLFDVGALTDTVLLRGRAGASELTLLTTPLDIGAHLVGTRSTVCAWVLRNDGTDSVTVDSLSMAPGPFRLVSPVGRVRLGPGDSLRVCIEFVPVARGLATSDLTAFVGKRRLPVQVIGRGVRRTGAAYALTAECDTVNYVDGVVASAFIDLVNEGDSSLIVSTATFAASSPGLFRLADPAALPRTLRPGERVRVEVLFAPVRESREVVNVTFPSNGDTVIAAELCFVALARTLTLSRSAIDFGNVCAADSARVSLLLENPSGVDPLTLQSLDVDPPGLVSVTGFVAGVLAPRAYQAIVVTSVAGATGPISGSLRIVTNRGTVTVPITGQAVPSVRFQLAPATATTGDTTTLAFSASGSTAGAMVSELELEIAYDRRLLLPVGVIVSGAPSPSQVRLELVEPGLASIRLQWGQAVPAEEIVVGVRCDVLRGDGRVAAVGIGGSGADVCVGSWTGTVATAPPCGDPAGLDIAGARLLRVTPVPAADAVGITLHGPDQGTAVIEIVDALGRPVLSRSIDAGAITRRVELSTLDLPDGLYHARASVDGRLIATAPVIITR